MQISSYVSDRQKKRRRRRAYLFTALGIVAAYILFFIVQWFIFHSPIFRVDHINVTGNQSVASDAVIALVEGSASTNHGWFSGLFGLKNMLGWPDQVPADQLKLIPPIDTLEISKDYFSHTVTIKVIQRNPIGIWCFPDSSCYWFDKTGTIFEKSFDTQGNLIYVVYDSTQKPRGLNDKVLPQDFLPNFISIIDVIRASNLTIKAIYLKDLSLEEVDVVTANGPSFYFSLRFPADNDLWVIQKIMLQTNFTKLQYIDCRTENRVYYK